MISEHSLSAEWLSEKKSLYSKDPSIMESMIYALYLLEKLQDTGLEFTFKGGTSLILLLEKPTRFSVDIDIIVSPTVQKEQLEEFLQQIPINSRFIRMELDERRSYKGKIPKAHYKFIYQANTSNKTKEGQVITAPEREILLDVLFEEMHYPVTTQCSIETEWLVTEPEIRLVTTPDIHSIAGDKLTAFAPTTVGVPYGVEKEKEIIKHLYDLECLFEHIEDLSIVKASFDKIAQNEINYRLNEPIEKSEILKDSIETGLILARRDNQQSEEDKVKFAELNKGIQQFGNFVFMRNFRIENAQLASAKVAYLSAMLLISPDAKLNKFNEQISPTSYLITHPDYHFLNKKLRFVAKGEALFYWFQTVELLTKER